MDISAKGRYGIKAILDLAVNSKGAHIALKQVAERQNISERYLEQVFSILRKAGFIKSVKGPQGGYSINCDITTTTMGDLLRALEGNLSVQKINPNSDSADKCINKVVWEVIDNGINTAVDNITLEELIETYKTDTGKSSYMFYI